MLDVMFDSTSHDGFSKVVVDREVVDGTKAPEVIKDSSSGDEKEAA